MSEPIAQVDIEAEILRLSRLAEDVTSAQRGHGTHNCYVHGPDRAYTGRGCRCTPCRAANAAYERHRARRVAPPYIDASEVREHVEALTAAGVGLKTIAARSGVAHGTVSKLIYGAPERGMAPSRRVRPTTAAKLLAVTVGDAADGSREPAKATHRNVATLRARGWTKTAIAHAIGQTGPGLQLGRSEVTRRNARAIAALLDQDPPPRRTRRGTTVASDWDRDQDERDQVRRRNEADRRAAYRGSDRYQLPVLPRLGLHVERAACRRPDVPGWLFFPSGQSTQTIAKAKAICETCPARRACLEWALTHDEQGIWGGTTETERAELRQAVAS